MRKPRAMRGFGSFGLFCWDDSENELEEAGDCRGISMGGWNITTHQARRVAAWLLKAADWLEAEK